MRTKLKSSCVYFQCSLHGKFIAMISAFSHVLTLFSPLFFKRVIDFSLLQTLYDLASQRGSFQWWGVDRDITLNSRNNEMPFLGELVVALAVLLYVKNPKPSSWTTVKGSWCEEMPTWRRQGSGTRALVVSSVQILLVCSLGADHQI